MRLNKIGVITSGGDVPGLNAALHTIVLTCTKRNINIVGINGGYDGLIDGNFSELDFPMVRNIMDKGGTIIHTSRSHRFLQSKWREKAYVHLKRAEIEGLLVIGGDGSLHGAEVFGRQFDYSIVGIPKTIDNDVYGTDYAIGFDTACNTIVEAIDRIKDTADSTSRIFIVEVMGRRTGALALHSGIAIAADAIIIPEVSPDIDQLLSDIAYSRRIGNRSMIIVITENSIPEGAIGLKKIIDAKLSDCDSRATVLGHIQRGGSPSAFDRNLASLLGYHAIVALEEGEKNIMVGTMNGAIRHTPLEDVASKRCKIDCELLKVANKLSLVI